MNIQKSLLDRESKTLEYKRELPSNFSNIIKTCVAFANTAGGKIMIGVEDKTLTILGTSDKEVDHALEAISAAVYESVSPALLPEVYAQQINNKEVIVIEISRGSTPPYFVKSLGAKKGVFVRVGPSTRTASEDHISELLTLRHRVLFDAEPSINTLESLDKKLLEDAYGRSPSQNLMLTERVLTKNIGKKLNATNAALLMFGSLPQDSIPECGIVCTRFKGSEGRDIIETQDIDGPIPEQISRSLSFLERHLERNFKMRGNQLRGQTLIPEVALREAVTNATIHRKYQIPARIKIAIFDNRVEIFSPGGLPGLISIANLGDGSSHLRNPLLAKFARRLRLAEKLGSGIRAMIDSCRISQIKQPEFFEDGDYVKVVLSTERVKSPTEDLDDTIRRFLDEFHEIRIRDIAKRTSASRNTITNTLNKMIKEKFVKRHGRGAGVYYKKT
jgi:ATP-dependent DNA helicase RecG